jgi:hypothetical protein
MKLIKSYLYSFFFFFKKLFFKDPAQKLKQCKTCFNQERPKEDAVNANILLLWLFFMAMVIIFVSS